MKNCTLKEVRPLTPAEVAQTFGGHAAMAAANAVANMIRGWQLVGCGTDDDGRTYCDYSIPNG